MKINTEDMIKQKLLDEQENVRDYEEYAKNINEEDVRETFKEFAEKSACHAQKLQKLLNKFE